MYLGYSSENISASDWSEFDPARNLTNLKVCLHESSNWKMKIFSFGLPLCFHAEDNFISHGFYFWIGIMFNLQKIETFHRKQDRKKFPGFFQISGFSCFFLKKRITTRNISEGRCRRKVFCFRNNIRIKNIFKLKENRDFSPFSEFSVFFRISAFHVFFI